MAHNTCVVRNEANEKDENVVNHKHYTYRVIWSEEDQEFVGLCAEFPSLSYLNEDMSAALTGIIQLVNEVVADMVVNNEPKP